MFVLFRLAVHTLPGWYCAARYGSESLKITVHASSPSGAQLTRSTGHGDKV